MYCSRFTPHGSFALKDYGQVNQLLQGSSDLTNGWQRCSVSYNIPDLFS